MATIDDLRRIALALPDAVEDEGPSFSVNGRAFTWPWRERVDPKKARVPRPDRPVLPVESLEVKALLVDNEPDAFFTEPHYNGYKAVIVRLDAISVDRLEEALADAHAVALEMGPPKPRRRKAG
jgi:hypothetical protein